jgi:5'/3'-nucleotidase
MMGREAPTKGDPVKRSRWIALPAALLVLLVPLHGGQTAPPFRILVTNDDGVRAPGIIAAAQALKELGEVTIVAPDTNQSAKGQALSVTDPIYADTVHLPGGLAATSLSATPASCVKVALDVLMPRQPDLVVSGINRGLNIGMVTYVSGTVGAAREAALHGIPAVAASLDSLADPHYEAAAAIVVRVVAQVKSRGLDRGLFLNVNVPAGTIDEIKGIRVTTQSAQSGMDRFEEQRAPSGRRYFWNIWQGPKNDAEGTDVWAVAQGYAAVTPLHVGELDRDALERWRTVRW